MANRIQKQKGVLLGVGIGLMALALGALIGGIIMLSISSKHKAGGSVFILTLVFGIVLVLLGLIGIGAGIRLTWVAAVLKATKGTVTTDNLGMKNENSQTITCPKCGCSNTKDSKKCSNCGTSLE